MSASNNAFCVIERRIILQEKYRLNTNQCGQTETIIVASIPLRRWHNCEMIERKNTLMHVCKIPQDYLLPVRFVSRDSQLDWYAAPGMTYRRTTKLWHFKFDLRFRLKDILFHERLRKSKRQIHHTKVYKCKVSPTPLGRSR